MDNLEEIDTSIKMLNLPRPNNKEKENVNRPITRKKVKSVINNLLPKKSPGPDSFTSEFYQTVK